MADELDAVVADRTVHGRPVVVRRLRPASRLGGLHVLFVGRGESARLPDLLAAAQGQPLLIVTESDEAPARGSMINFVVVDDKVRFDVALRAAERGKLKISVAPAGAWRARSWQVRHDAAYSATRCERKLIGVVLLTTLVALIVALGAMIAYDLRAYHRGWISDISTQAELLGRTTAPALAFDDARLASENLDLLRFRPQVRAAAIYNARGTLFATFAAAAPRGTFPPLPEADGVRVAGATWSCSSASSTTARSSAPCTCGPTTSCTTAS